ncbi:hypothetical protein K457DRAFT_37014 [Linnemannia elongata AG-77]|uniref:Uncharacterized protein n=1 Tax=Linnemannia elongata AG-77 TaxID=1314771 RepID=A0A197JCB2_9FUNG|nr:hypothetical protein K457DRAFT_37014 [Linnemannia elongata AG-77]
MNRNRTSSIPQPGLDRPPPRPVYNDSFNQPDEPFECDLSAIYPQNDDDLSISDTEDYQDDSMYSSSFQETTGHHDGYRQPTHTHTNTSGSHNQSQHQNHPQDTLHSRYLEVESASWTAAHQDEEVPEGGDFEDEEEQEEDEEEDDQFLGGGRARLSTIAELSELPSINLNHNHHNNLRSHYSHNNPHRTPSALATTHNTSSSNNNNTSATGAASNSRRLEPAQSGHLVISRDLVLEDLFVEGQEEAENAEDEVRQQLMANLKPTDILGPIHETRDFQLSSLTGPGRQWERQDQHVPQDEEEQPDDQDMEDDEEDKNSQHDSFVREEGESDLSSTALALKREYEALFGSKGAIDSERSGSDANGLLGYENSDDLYPRGDDDDEDDFFGDEDDEEVDEAEEEFYAMLDLNGGVGNMILGNNIPRKPRVLAPPPGSRLPVPGSANKEKVPLALQSKIVSRVPAVRSPMPSASASPSPSPAPSSPAPVQPVSRIVPPTTGLRPPQVAAKRGPETMSSLPTPSTSATTPKPATQSAQQPSNTTVSILDGLWKEQEYDSHPEESPGAIFAAKVAKELMREKQESLLAAQAAPRTSLLKPRLKLPSARSTVVMPEGDVERLTNMLKIEEAPAAAKAPTTTSATRPQSMLVAPTPVSKLARPSIVPPRVRSVASPIPPRSLTASPVRAPSKSPLPPSSSGSSPRPVATYTKSRAEAPASGQRSGTVTPKNSSKAASFVKEASMDESMEQQERPQELARRRSAERKRHLQRELELIEAEEAEEAAAAAEAEEKKMATPRKLSVRTSSELAENRRSKDFQQSLHRRSSERERERGSVPTSPLSPLSPHRSGGISSKRSSLYDMNGERKVPSLEESCKQLAKIRQDIVELREEIYQDQPGTSFTSPTSAGPRASTAGKRPSGRDRDRDREAHSRRNSLENKPQNGAGGRETRPQLGRSDSYHSSAPSSPEVKASTRRHFFGDILGKLSRNSLHVSTSGPAPSSASTSQQQSKTSPTYRKSQTPSSQSHPIKSMSRSMIDSEQPAATVPRTPTSAYPGGRTSTTYRHSTHQPMSPVASRDKQMGYEDRYHSGSSGQSAEFYDEPAYYDQYHYPTSANNNPYKQSQSSMSASHRARQQQQQQQRQLGSNQTSHHFRQAHDGSLILSDSPPITSAMTDGMEFGATGCPAQIRPKELRFSNSVAGEIQSTVTLSNRSNRTMHYEILRPAGISVSPSFGMIQPGRDQRLTVHLAENRGPGRVVVELDGEWLVPFGISFD